MDLIIGRDSATSCLRLNAGAQSKTYGVAGSVPMSVSRQHCRLRDNGDGTYVLTNLKPENATYVNGQAVDAKQVTNKDRVELGNGRYPLDWAAVEAMMPVVIDINPLERVWDHYHDERQRMQVTERRFNALRSATGLVTMTAIMCSFVLGRSTIYILLYVLAIVVTLLCTVKAYKSSSKIPKQTDELDKAFRHDYVCPKCGHFMGFQPFDVLSQNTACPYCRAQYKQKKQA